MATWYRLLELNGRNQRLGRSRPEGQFPSGIVYNFLRRWLALFLDPLVSILSRAVAG